MYVRMCVCVFICVNTYTLTLTYYFKFVYRSKTLVLQFERTPKDNGTIIVYSHTHSFKIGLGSDRWFVPFEEPVCPFQPPSVVYIKCC